jgi:hypothetical protein
VQYAGPAVLPWLWQPVEQDGEVILQPQPIPYFAGPSGKAQDCPACSMVLQLKRRDGITFPCCVCQWEPFHAFVRAG